MSAVKNNALNLLVTIAVLTIERIIFEILYRALFGGSRLKLLMGVLAFTSQVLIYWFIYFFYIRQVTHV